MHSLSVGQVTRNIFPDWQRERTSTHLMKKLAPRSARISLVVAAELALAALSYALAVHVQAEARGAAWSNDVIRKTLGLLILFRLGALISVRLYRRSLRYASVPDLLAIAKAVTISSVFFCAFVSWQFPELKVPNSVFTVDWAFLQLLWGALHFGPRMVKTQQAVLRTEGKRVVIVGAGDAGMALLKELALDSTSHCLPVAVVDDDPEKQGRTIHGVPIVGGIAGLAELAAKLRAEEILICIPSATTAQMHSILAVLRNTTIPVRTLPSLAELVDGQVSRRDLRRPRIEDLLPREEIRVDLEATRKIVGGKVVLVTGAGGSIGSELCRQIAAAEPRKLLLLDKSENSLFYVNLEACERLGPTRVKAHLADLIYGNRIREILRSERPEIVFHGAAHKHVGLLESHPQEAIRNNVIGTRNLAEAAREYGVAQFVNISTDKAVNPRNYMGLSKKLTELCIQELARTSTTRLVNVRFGNVAGSTGSVLRLFWEQIQKGAPIRVTDPRAMRYFMSVPEAVHLILRAAALGKGGETFVFEMGEPLNIYELAKTMTLFAGLRPERDLAIEFTGLAEGEKITEELWEDWERPVRTESDQILVISEQNPLSRGILEKIHTMEGFLMREDYEGLLEYLHELAPDFNCQRNPCGKVVIPTPAPEVFEGVSQGAI
jgi:FlaA1/EpsC-like NDP-sugar epimerase